MCRQFDLLPEYAVHDIARNLAAKEASDLALGDSCAESLSSAFPGSEAQVLALGNSDLSVERMVWGFEVSWQKGLLFNTRIERMLEPQSMWHRAALEGRVVVPTCGFYETHRSETVRSARTGKQVKRRYRFYLPQGRVFFLACVSEGGRFSVVTTDPNPDVSAVHDRMPVALLPAEVATWLDGDFSALVNRQGLKLAADPVRTEGECVQPRLF